MAKPHWTHEDEAGQQFFGCQHSECVNRAARQHNRQATADEVNAILATALNGGPNHIDPAGEYRVAVFTCDEHAPDVEASTLVHEPYCPLPDHGCECG